MGHWYAAAWTVIAPPDGVGVSQVVRLSLATLRKSSVEEADDRNLFEMAYSATVRRSGYIGQVVGGSGHRETELTHPVKHCHAKAMEIRRLALLIGILGLFANSLDCYGAWIMSKQARDCCNSGHCSPANHDPCCKTAPSGGNQLFVAHEKAPVNPPIMALGVVVISAVPLPISMPAHRFGIGSDIPPPLAFRSTSLPLLI